tara:strand:+ start:318 stop:596 length:279 start_codon:yes stop_codon:yes gene_type:complete
MEKIKKPRSQKQIENTKRLVEKNRLKNLEIKKQKELGTYVKPIRKKKLKKEPEKAIIETPELIDNDGNDNESVSDDDLPGYEHLNLKYSDTK